MGEERHDEANSSCNSYNVWCREDVEAVEAKRPMFAAATAATQTQLSSITVACDRETWQTPTASGEELPYTNQHLQQRMPEQHKLHIMPPKEFELRRCDCEESACGTKPETSTTDVTQQRRSPSPPSYIAWSVLSLLLFCLPLGLAALVCSAGVLSDLDAGRYDAARRKSRAARWLNVADAALGIVAWLALLAQLGLQTLSAADAMRDLGSMD